MLAIWQEALQSRGTGGLKKLAPVDGWGGRTDLSDAVYVGERTFTLDHAPPVFQLHED